MVSFQYSHQNQCANNGELNLYNTKFTTGRRTAGELNLQESSSSCTRKRNLTEWGTRSREVGFRRPLPITMICNANHDCDGDSSDDEDFNISRKLLRRRHIQKEQRERKRREALRKQARAPTVARKRTWEESERHIAKEKNSADVKEGGLLYTSGSEWGCSDIDGDDERNVSKCIAHCRQKIRTDHDNNSVSNNFVFRL